jgi:hypothetical protein
MKISKRIKALKSKIAEAQSEIKEIQDSCPHDAASITRCRDDGTSFYVEVRCPDCAANITYDKDRHAERYNHFAMMQFIRVCNSSPK